MAKIIAITKPESQYSNGSYLIELTQSEIISLLRVRPKDRDGFQVGDEIPLEPLKERLESLETREREVSEFSAALERVSNRVTARNAQANAS